MECRLEGIGGDWYRLATDSIPISGKSRSETEYSVPWECNVISNHIQIISSKVDMSIAVPLPRLLDFRSFA